MCLIIILFLLNEFLFIIYNSLLPSEKGRVTAKGGPLVAQDLMGVMSLFGELDQSSVALHKK